MFKWTSVHERKLFYNFKEAPEWTQCQCAECGKLLKRENRWIMRVGTFFGNSGLTLRDEIKSKVRGQYRREGM